MSEAWSPEVAVTVNEAKRLLEEQFPQLKPVTVKELGKGFDNTVFKVNEKYVFRFPRKEIAIELLMTESKLLPLLVQDLPIDIPEPIFFGKASSTYKWPFTGYRIVNGESPGEMTNDVREKSAELLGGFLKKLHQFPVGKAKEVGVPPDRLERTNIGKRKSRLIENVKKAVEHQLIDDAQTALEWIDSLEEVELDTRLTLVHGDCHIRNILVDDHGVISGIIDWGDTHIGHPAIDISIVYSFLPPSGREKFFQIYGEVSDATKVGARFFALYVSVLLALYGHDLGDERLVASAKESIKLSLS
ncbi:phosphotransferase [Neobacillus sp. D3-1R]|uniref:phosphotransferase n=1 Tax=Neobacillus sp. D3-1R TaxID=3445778 RepID=UPI003F9FC5E9